jgi:hypothetical protein
MTNDEIAAARDVAKELCEHARFDFDPGGTEYAAELIERLCDEVEALKALRWNEYVKGMKSHDPA